MASPVRKMPETGEVIRSVLKPIGQPYRSTAIDTNKDVIIEAEIEPATEEEIEATTTVMGRPRLGALDVCFTRSRCFG